MKILLVGNYKFDGSMSMHIWASALERDLRELSLDVRLITPAPVFGQWKPSANSLSKWLGYIDRYVLFPRVLRAAAAEADVVHMCDHGSAMYCSILDGKPTVVTCHDMLAVRGAMGELPEMRTSRCGRYMQKWICRGLDRATRVACISQATFDDASRILRRSDHLSVILNALNYPFHPLDPRESERRLRGIDGINKPFLLHVGHSHKRKNRDGILRIFAEVAAKADLQLVFAGQALTAELNQLANGLRVSSRIVQITKPDVSVIEALYNRATALIFPSRYEGFGWPPIEAQACGCPVVASDIPSLREILGETALLHSVNDETGMAESIIRLTIDQDLRESLCLKGFENVWARFQTSRAMNEYVAFYHQVVEQSDASSLQQIAKVPPNAELVGLRTL